MTPLWQSSALLKPNCQIKIIDINNDSENELITLEGDYTKNTNCQPKYISVWKWNHWGFTNLWRSKKTNYNSLKVAKIAKKKYIIVEKALVAQWTEQLPSKQ